MEPWSWSLFGEALLPAKKQVWYFSQKDSQVPRPVGLGFPSSAGMSGSVRPCLFCPSSSELGEERSSHVCGKTSIDAQIPMMRAMTLV